MPRNRIHFRPELFRWITKMFAHIRSKMIVIKTVIRQKNDSGVGSNQVEESTEQHIVEAIHAGDDVPEKGSILRTHVRHRRRVVFHEAVAGVINGVVVNREKIPIFFRGKVCRRILRGGALSKNTRQHSDPWIGFIGRLRIRKKREQLLG